MRKLDDKKTSEKESSSDIDDSKNSRGRNKLLLIYCMLLVYISVVVVLIQSFKYSIYSYEFQFLIILLPVLVISILVSMFVILIKQNKVLKDQRTNIDEQINQAKENPTFDYINRIVDLYDERINQCRRDISALKVIKHPWSVYSIIISTISVIFSIFVLVKLYPRSNILKFDYLGLIVGILAILVTALIGFQIFQTFKFKEEEDRFVESVLGQIDIKKLSFNNIVDKAKREISQDKDEFHSNYNLIIETQINQYLSMMYINHRHDGHKYYYETLNYGLDAIFLADQCGNIVLCKKSILEVINFIEGSECKLDISAKQLMLYHVSKFEWNSELDKLYNRLIETINKIES